MVFSLSVTYWPDRHSFYVDSLQVGGYFGGAGCNSASLRHILKMTD